MKRLLKNILQESAALLVPLASIMLLVLILSIPRTGGYWNFLRQAPFYAGIYFWQSQRPDAFNIFSAFILGIFADVLGGAPLGINIMSFLILYIIAVRITAQFNIRRFSYSWLLFSGATFLTFVFKTLIVSAFYRRFIPLNLIVLELALIIAAYPLFARIYIWIERRFIHLEVRYEKIEP